jgi:RHS repeat-associated protein
MTGHGARGGRRRWLDLALTIGSALSLVAALLAGVDLLTGGWRSAPASSAGRPVPVHTVPGHAVRIPPMKAGERPTATWPAASSGTAVIAAAAAPQPKSFSSSALPTPGSARAGDLPVWVGPPGGSSGPATVAYTSGSAVSRAQVSMASHAVADALGVHGVVFSVGRADGGSAAGGVHVSLDYSAFAHAYGGDYASRLRLVELPACALSTPDVARCRTWTTLPAGSADSVTAERVGANVTLPGTGTAAVSAPRVVLAAMAGPSGSGGTYAASPVSDASEWVTGGNSGAFTDSYPITVPPVPGGLEPTVNLAYDSQATDGLTSATNNQTSWIGDGWNYSPGFIEEPFQTCSQIPQQLSPTGDLCNPYPSQPMTLSLNGTTTSLVSGKNGYRAEADAGAQIGEVVPPGSSPEGTQTYWVLTQPNGTTYYFGLNQLPGWASGDPATNSVWSLPVAESSIQHLYNTDVWRWNLDYVVDPRGNAIAYFYNTQTNYYAEDNGTTGSAAYTQGGVLAKIEYGLRAGNIYGYTPAAQVTFTVATSRQDAPDDLACSSGAACSVTSPTFWSDDALTGITAQSLSGGSLHTVDSWALADAYPATGDPTTSPSLWLSSITRTGHDGPSSITLPPTSFGGTPMPDRVQTAADQAAGYSLITRFRLTSVTNETGGVTTIAYSGQDSTCAAGTFPAPGTNTTACYPAYWLPPGASSPVLDWFNLYTVTSATSTDTTGGDPPVITGHTYAGAAWHYNDDSVARSTTTTWDEWRGYRTVTTQTGTSPDPVTQTVDTYLQGMAWDWPGNTTVTVTSSRGDTVTDSDGYAGSLFESIVYDRAGTGNQVTDTIHVPSGTTTGTSGGWTSVMTEDNVEKTYTTLAGGGTRESTKTYTYDSYGNVLTASYVPDTSNPAEDTCTTTTYDYNNTTTYLVDLPATVQVVDLPCGTLATQASQLISDTVNTYDNGSYYPTAGNLTKVQRATAATVQYIPLGYTNPWVWTYTYGSTSTYTYDQYGRPLTATDADHRTTTTAYTPATGAEPTSVQVTDPAGLATTTTYDPARDLPLTVTDPAGDQTTKAYDALGRVTSSWTPGNPASGPAVDTYSYTVTNTTPSVTTEQEEQPGGGYLTHQTIYDSLGQVRETQDQTASGGTDVSDTSYDSDGWKALASDPYYVTGAPSGTLVAAASSSVPSQTGYVYDGDGRLTRQIAYALGAEAWETDTSYGGNYVTVVPPSGGTGETTFTDGRNLTTAIYQYHAGVPASPSDPAADYDQTSYTYTPAKQLAGITDAARNTWSYTYDLLGNQLTQADPDTGTATSTYDPAGQLMTVTDARGKQLSYTYDADGRKTAEYDTTGGAAESSADQLASWTYDTLAKGQPTSSTAYQNGAPYTEQVTGYGSNGMPSGTETVIPAAQGALAGTYTQQDTYAPTGQLTSYTDSASGGLPAETVTTGYNSAGQADSLNGASAYVDSLSYTNVGLPLQYTMGSSGQPVYLTDSYDPQTGRLTEQNTQAGTGQASVDDLHYTYDDVGDVTSGASAATDVQCFTYDYLGRLSQAWAQGSTGCAATPSASAEGGAAPYWGSYTYNAIGDLTGITATTPSGAVTTTTESYPSAGSARPHAVTTATVASSSGTAATSYGYDATGNLTSAAGPSQSQALTWNDAGQLSQDAVTPADGSAQNTGYIYDAGGHLLLTADPGTTTLYLPDEQLSLNTSTGTVTGTRYYSLNGVTVAARTGASGLAYLAGDQQGTDTVAIDSATLAITRRYYDPYGNPRGTTTQGFPTGTKGFIGGSSDTATGLTDLGAREYQPGTGSFISTDSLLKPYDPQDLDPYAYAEDNPATHSDPTGAGTGTPVPPPGGCVGSGCGNSPTSATSGSRGCSSVQVGAVWLSPCTVPNVWQILQDYQAEIKYLKSIGALDPGVLGELQALHSVCTDTGPCGRSLGVALYEQWKNITLQTVGFGDLVGTGIGLGSLAGPRAGDTGRILAEIINAEQDASQLSEEFGGCNSFPGNTKVLLADGKKTRIKQIKAGTKVTATDPLTGKTSAEQVTRTTITKTDTEFSTVTIKTVNGLAAITSTTHHLYWDATNREWTFAGSLRPGDRLQSLGGQAAIIVSVRSFIEHTVTYNLTVDHLHTYYVQAGGTPVLVHNCPITPNITKDGLEHSFGSHAKQWFGGEPKKSLQMDEWEGLIVRASKSKTIVEWDSHGIPTYAYLTKIDGKWFAAQFDRSTGDLVTAFVPNSGQVRAMLAKLFGN